MKAQLRIDWQQCYGGLGIDEPAKFLPKDKGYIILGVSDLGSGMIACGDQGSTGAWVVEIDENHEIVNQDCFQGYHGILKAKDIIFMGRRFSLQQGIQEFWLFERMTISISFGNALWAVRNTIFHTAFMELSPMTAALFVPRAKAFGHVEMPVNFLAVRIFGS